MCLLYRIYLLTKVHICSVCKIYIVISFGTYKVGTLNANITHRGQSDRLYRTHISILAKLQGNVICDQFKKSFSDYRFESWLLSCRAFHLVSFTLNGCHVISPVWLHSCFFCSAAKWNHCFILYLCWIFVLVVHTSYMFIECRVQRHKSSRVLVE